MASADRRKQTVADSVWCGGAACALLLLMDAFALANGSRADIPAGALWIMVAGLLLPVLNVYFVIKDAGGGRFPAAVLGAVLSGLALWVAVAPPWAQYVIR